MYGNYSQADVVVIRFKVYAIVLIVISMVVTGIMLGVVYLNNVGNGAPSLVEDTDLLGQNIEMPNLNMTLTNDTVVGLYDLRGQVLLIELMATWCSACEAQIINLQSLQDTRTTGIKIISLSVDVSETPAVMAAYKQEHGYDWDSGVENDGGFSSFLDLEYVPTLIIIDPDGFLRWIHVGTWAASSMDSTLTSLGL